MLECHKTTEDESLSGQNHSNKAEQHRKPLRRAGIMKDYGQREAVKPLSGRRVRRISGMQGSR